MDLEMVRTNVWDLLERYGLNHEYLTNIEFREAADNLVVFTTEGELALGAKQIIRVPENVLTFSEAFILHLFAHEVVHIWQKTAEPLVLDKNEREFQAYYNGVFPYWFAGLPSCPEKLRKTFANQALRYFGMMNQKLKKRYNSQKIEIEDFLFNKHQE